MKRMIGNQMLLVSSLVLAGIGFQVLGQENSQAAPERPNQESKAEKSGKGSGMMQCPMMAAMKDVKLFADSPPVVLSQAEKLNLTDQQRRQLQEIGDSAREQALSVLSAEQREQVEKAPSGPVSMMQLTKLQKKEGTADEGKGMCPMCLKMMQMKMKNSSVGEKTDKQPKNTREE